MNNIALELVTLLRNKNLSISTCESCTGGLVASTIISIPGASNIINESYITYSNESKIRILGVDNKTIKEYGVQSAEVAEEMVEGLFDKTLANVCISVTGFTKGDEPLDTDGLFYFGIMISIKNKHYTEIFKDMAIGNTREEIRENQVSIILNKVLEMVKEY